MIFQPSDANVFVQEDVVMFIFRNSQHHFYIEDDLTNNKLSANNYLLELNGRSCNGGIGKIEMSDEVLKFVLDEAGRQRLGEEFIQMEIEVGKYGDLKKEMQSFGRAYGV